MIRSEIRCTALALLVVGLAAGLPASAGEGDVPRAVSGRLDKIGEIPVLEIWGDPQQSGYAQGYLLAESLPTLFDDYILDPKILRNPAIYEGLTQQIRQFDWPASVITELTALEKGVRDRIGQRFRSEKLDRELGLDDLLTANIMADMLGMACSSFSVWGPFTADGQTLTGRNLDFPFTPAMIKSQIVVVRHAETGDGGWVGVTWPGLVGAYTAMNARGVTIAMHDAPGLTLSDPLGATPRSLTLRLALESAKPETFAKDIEQVLAAHRVRVGNNIHTSAPVTGSRPPAAVFEWDGNPREHGVQVRLPATSDWQATALCCTNHMRTRRDARPCERYTKFSAAFDEARAQGAKIGVEQAFALLRDVGQRSTLHSVVFEPAAGKMHVLISALQPTAIDIDVRERLRQRTETARKAIP